MVPPFQFYARRGLQAWALLALCIALSLRPGLASDTVARDRRLDHLVCGVVSEPEDWNKDDVHGDLSAAAARLCDAVAASLAPNGHAAGIRRFASEAEALDGLAAGQADLVIGVTPGAAAKARRAAIGPVVHRDALVFAVRPASGITSIAAIDRRTLCFIDGTTTGELALDTLARQGIRPIPFPFQEQGEMDAAVAGGRCEAVAGAASRLASFRAQFGPLDYLVPPFGMVPATVATRQGDALWTTAVARAVEAVLPKGSEAGCTEDRRSDPATRPHPPSPCR